MTAEPAAAPKKRKKKRAEAPNPPKAAETADTRAGWPAFAKHFPDHPEIERLVNAFEEGNYALVRTDAARLIETMKALPETETKPSKPSKAQEKAQEEAEGAASLPKMPKPSAEQRKEIQKAAAELLTRIEPPKLSVYMLLGSMLLLVFLALWYWTHPQHP